MNICQSSSTRILSHPQISTVREDLIVSILTLISTTSSSNQRIIHESLPFVGNQILVNSQLTCRASYWTLPPHEPQPAWGTTVGKLHEPPQDNTISLEQRLRIKLTQKHKLISRGLNFLFKSINSLVTFQCETIFSRKYPTISPLMHEYISVIIHENLDPSRNLDLP